MTRLATRLWYGWTLLVYLLVSLVLWGPFVLVLQLRPTARTFWRWLRAWAGAIFAGVGFRVDATQGAPVEGAVVYVSNHQAMMDIPVLTLSLRQPFVFVARSSLRRLPLVGSILAVSRCVFLERGSAEGVERAMQESAERLASGESVLFFPEGTRSYEQMKPFRRGAFRLALDAGVPVVPVAIDGAHLLFDERQRAARPGRVRVCIGDPMPALPGETDRQFAERAQAEVARMLG